MEPDGQEATQVPPFVQQLVDLSLLPFQKGDGLIRCWSRVNETAGTAGNAIFARTRRQPVYTLHCAPLSSASCDVALATAHISLFSLPAQKGAVQCYGSPECVTPVGLAIGFPGLSRR